MSFTPCRIRWSPSLLSWCATIELGRISNDNCGVLCTLFHTQSGARSTLKRNTRVEWIKPLLNKFPLIHIAIRSFYLWDITPSDYGSLHGDIFMPANFCSAVQLNSRHHLKHIKSPGTQCNEIFNTLWVYPYLFPIYNPSPAPGITKRPKHDQLGCCSMCPCLTLTFLCTIPKEKKLPKCPLLCNQWRKLASVEALMSIPTPLHAMQN